VCVYVYICHVALIPKNISNAAKFAELVHINSFAEVEATITEIH